MKSGVWLRKAVYLLNHRLERGGPVSFHMTLFNPLRRWCHVSWEQNSVPDLAIRDTAGTAGTCALFVRGRIKEGLLAFLTFSTYAELERMVPMHSPSNRILCVDDNEDTGFMLTTLLSYSNIEAVSVSSVVEALNLIENEYFNLYLIDTILPDISGLDLCRTIRRIDKSTPIIFYSAAAFPRDLESGLLAGANAYLVKPDLDELVPTITQLLIESSATALRMAG